MTGDLTGTARAAVTLSAALGGARVTVECPLSEAAAAALGRDIRQGLDGGPWRVESVTVTGNPPHLGAVKLTVAGA